MPTYTEQNELLENCTWTWTAQNGVNGYLVASKTNGNSIFLPAAGSRNVNNVGEVGHYWSSSVQRPGKTARPDYAWTLNLETPSEGNDHSLYMDRYPRNWGLSVRAVCE